VAPARARLVAPFVAAATTLALAFGLTVWVIGWAAAFALLFSAGVTVVLADAARRLLTHAGSRLDHGSGKTSAGS
jgi:hypothetical protein